MTEGHVTGAYIRGYGVQPVQEGGRRTGGGGEEVQIPGATLGPNIQWMAVYMLEHEEGAESPGSDRKDDAEIGGGYPGVGNVVQGGGPGGATVRIGTVGNIVSDGEDGGGCARRVTGTYQRESGADKSRCDIDDTGGE